MNSFSGWIRRARLGSAIVLAALLGHVSPRIAVPAASVPQAGHSQPRRLTGEYGLYIRQLDTGLEVHWITATADSGWLRLFGPDSDAHELRTPKGRVHRAMLAVRWDKTAVLEYGALHRPDDRHRTTVRPSRRVRHPRRKFSKVDSIYVVGDVHGEFGRVTGLLQHAGLLDADLHWRGGHAHLVFLGDLFDRGPDVTRTLWLLYQLEAEARAAGGFLHIVLGNHEIMTFVGDARYLSTKERLVAAYHGVPYATLFDPHDSLLGRWLASKPGLLKINNILFAHGGVSPVYKPYTVQSLNDSIFAYLHEPILPFLLADSIDKAQFSEVVWEHRRTFFFHPETIFWHRGYVQSDTLQAELRETLKVFKSRTHVVAHTPVQTISQFYNGRLIAVDLEKAATELLLLVRRGKKYDRFKIDLQGKIARLADSPVTDAGRN